MLLYTIKNGFEESRHFLLGNHENPCHSRRDVANMLILVSRCSRLIPAIPTHSRYSPLADIKYFPSNSHDILIDSLAFILAFPDSRFGNPVMLEAVSLHGKFELVIFARQCLMI